MFSTSRRCFASPYALRLCRVPTAPRAAYFSQTSHYRSTSGSHEDGKREDQDSYTRVLAVFALSIPLGWGLHYLGDSRDGSSQIAKPTDFVRYALAGKEDISSTCSIFTLRPAQGSRIDTTVLYDPRAITSVQFKQPQLQIARSYTVLPPIEEQASDELRFLIRKEQRGEVSGYLHRLALGAEIEVRGPSVDYVLPEGVEDVVFLAGGTGIAPALQIANKGIRGTTHILWANRKREDCFGGVSDTPEPQSSSSWNLLAWWNRPITAVANASNSPQAMNTRDHAIVQQIESLKTRRDTGSLTPGGLTIDYCVDEEGTFIRPAGLSNMLHAQSSHQRKRLILISGPDGFVNYWAGPKQWVGGREVQGPLGGALAALDLKGWEVIKL
ncbi:hypothetical protein LTR56_017000 [Elasticomyces elasticus]|nr:hypothetical protein LTR56_017000 [Elasticomyces elasticus]KAK3636116.1 hypothetical protein LTR22_018874 [Elasticomyces elasticus]KAK4912115.1 hypothetical protein LTR49_019401 [Elasticomyces elasticus]KAK5753639.1 hypothetical protein LTS12_016276 [Elasticomyces elasticus]